MQNINNAQDNRTTRPKQLMLRRLSSNEDTAAAKDAVSERVSKINNPESFTPCFTTIGVFQSEWWSYDNAVCVWTWLTSNMGIPNQPGQSCPDCSEVSRELSKVYIVAFRRKQAQSNTSNIRTQHFSNSWRLALAFLTNYNQKPSLSTSLVFHWILCLALQATPPLHRPTCDMSQPIKSHRTPGPS